MRPHRTKVEPYGARLIYAHHPDQWAPVARAYDLEAEPQSIGSTTIALDTENVAEPHLVVWVDAVNLTDPSRRVRTVVHEATHAALLLLTHLGHTITGDDEPTAYLVDWIAGWLLDRTPEVAS